MRERLQDERRGFADHCRVDTTGDRVHALPEYLETSRYRPSSGAGCSGRTTPEPKKVNERKELATASRVGFPSR